MMITRIIGKPVLGIFITTVMLTTLLPSTSPGLGKMPAFVEYKASDDYFKCKIPADWNIYNPVFGLSQEERRVYGLTLLGPQNGGRVPPAISIHYYAPGNLTHDTMNIFVKRHSVPVLGFVEEGESYGEVRQIKFAGRQVKVFERIDIRFIGERIINPLKVSIFEKFIVVPAEKEKGFYAIKLSAPIDTKDKNVAIYEEVLKSFLPQR
jgi:hypothetical protein